MTAFPQTIYFDYGLQAISSSNSIWNYPELDNVDFLLGILDFYSPDSNISILALGWTKIANSTTSIQIALTFLTTASYPYIAYGVYINETNTANGTNNGTNNSTNNSTNNGTNNGTKN